MFDTASLKLSKESTPTKVDTSLSASRVEWVVTVVNHPDLSKDLATLLGWALVMRTNCRRNIFIGLVEQRARGG